MSKKPLKIQASSISRIMKCPGSCTLESKLPDRLRYFAYKDAAEYGTMCHAVGESALLHGGKCGHDIMVKVYQHPRAEDVYTIGHAYAAAVLARRPRGSKMFVEEKFRATVHGVDCVAKSDAYFITPKTIQKFDLKSGPFDYYESARLQMEYAARLCATSMTITTGARSRQQPYSPRIIRRPAAWWTLRLLRIPARRFPILSRK